MKLSQTLFTVCCFAVAAVTNAQVVVQGPKTLDPATPANFDKFDTALGLLTSVQIELTYTVDAFNVFLDNDAATPGNGTLTTNALYTFDILTLGISGSQNNNSSNTVTLDANIGDSAPTFDFQTGANGADNATINIGAISNTLTQTYTTPSILTLFNGPGNFDITNSLGILNNLTITNVASSVESVTTMGSAKVTYNYAVIPEPSAYAGILALMGGLYLCVRRRA